MKKMIKCVSAYLIVLVLTSSFKPATAGEPLVGTAMPANENNVESYITSLYNQIDFSKVTPLSYDVFSKACHGYINLRNEGKLNAGKEIISVCDFSLPSSANRLWIIDLAQKKVLFNTYVAHGQGSGQTYANAFSNSADSHQSSLGFYVTGQTYDGKHGTSLHLLGMDEGFNDAAFDRGIVVHGANYVSESFIKGNEYLGRSWGCPAVSSELSLPIINTIKDSTCLFIYAPQEQYLKSAYWLNKKISDVPGTFQGSACGQAIAPKISTIQYMSKDGKIDSVKTFAVSQ